MSERTLTPFINSQPVGMLRDVNGIWAFKYDDLWLNNPRRYALCPSLPLTPEPLLDQSTQRPVQWYFDNLLPEEGQRTLLAKDAGIDAADAFALLEYYGSESAGSLTLLPSGSISADEGTLRPLSDGELSARIRNLPYVPLTHGAGKKMSLAGAQHKLPVVVQGGELFEPTGKQPSTHILKPNHPDPDFPHSVVNEWFAMRLAASLGLESPAVERRYVPEPVYLVERFDRVRIADQWTRRHAIDACQLLGIDRTFKYQQCSMESLASLANACRSPAVARTRLFSWLVFNVLIGNADAHLKNLSSLVSHEGIQPAPFYDLLNTAVYETLAFGKSRWPNESKFAWPIMGIEKFSGMTRNVLFDAAAVLNLQKSTAERLLENVRGRINAKSEELIQQVEAENNVLLETRPELAATLGGEMRCLRAIQHTVIRDMAERLE